MQKGRVNDTGRGDGTAPIITRMGGEAVWYSACVVWFLGRFSELINDLHIALSHSIFTFCGVICVLPRRPRMPSS